MRSVSYLLWSVAALAATMHPTASLAQARREIVPEVRGRSEEVAREILRRSAFTSVAVLYTRSTTSPIIERLRGEALYETVIEQYPLPGREWLISDPVVLAFFEPPAPTPETERLSGIIPIRVPVEAVNARDGSLLSRTALTFDQPVRVVGGDIVPARISDPQRIRVVVPTAAEPPPLSITAMLPIAVPLEVVNAADGSSLRSATLRVEVPVRAADGEVLLLQGPGPQTVPVDVPDGGIEAQPRETTTTIPVAVPVHVIDDESGAVMSSATLALDLPVRVAGGRVELIRPPELEEVRTEVPVTEPPLPWTTYVLATLFVLMAAGIGIAGATLFPGLRERLPKRWVREGRERDARARRKARRPQSVGIVDEGTWVRGGQLVARTEAPPTGGDRP